MNEPSEPSQTPVGGPAQWPMPPYMDRHAMRAYARAQRQAARRTNPDYHPGLVFGLLFVLIGGLGILSQLVPGFDAALIWAMAFLALGAAVVIRAFSR